MTDTDLATRFVETLDHLDLPEVDLVDRVLAACEQADAVSPTEPRGLRPAPWLALAAAVTIAVVLVVAPARRAVADWFGIGATQVEPAPATTTAPLPTSTTLGAPVAVEPTVDPIPSLGSPMAVFDDDGRGRSYVWPATDELPPIGESEGDNGVILSVRPADREVATKLTDLTEVTYVTIGPDRITGLWIGSAHAFVAAGSSRSVSADRVLLWERDGIEFRLESGLGELDAVALAAAVKGGTDLLAPG